MPPTEKSEIICLCRSEKVLIRAEAHTVFVYVGQSTHHPGRNHWIVGLDNVKGDLHTVKANTVSYVQQYSHILGAGWRLAVITHQVSGENYAVLPCCIYE